MTKMWLEISEQPKVLSNCMERNSKVIKEIADIINKSDVKQVIIAARGTSGHAGLYGKYLIEIKTGIPVSIAAPSVFTLYNKSLCMKNSLVIGISQSGCAADVIEVIKSANSQGAVTLGITNDQSSPLAAEAKYHLFCAAGPEKSVAATKTFTSQLYLLAQLAAYRASDQKFLDELKNVPVLVEKTLENAQKIKEIVNRYRFMNECFVLARGINYPIARESALKIQETSYVRARAYAISEFHHGPFAMLDDQMPVIIYAPYDKTQEDAKQMIKKIKDNTGADILIVSNNEDTLSMGDCGIHIPDAENEFLIPILNAVTAQLFALNLSLLKGRNPDAPRGLKKVTITR